MNTLKKYYQDNVVLGFWLYLMSDCILFASLFATYAVLNTAVAGGPQGGDLFSLNTVFIQTLLLLTSSFSMGMAVLAGRYGNKRLMLVALAATLGLGLGFLGLEVSEFCHLVLDGNGPARSAFLSSFMALVGTHGLHVATGSIWMLVVMVKTGRHQVSTGGHLVSTPLTCLALFWHFLDIIWIFIFSFVYLFGLI